MRRSPSPFGCSGSVPSIASLWKWDILKAHLTIQSYSSSSSSPHSQWAHGCLIYLLNNLRGRNSAMRVLKEKQPKYVCKVATV